MTQENKMADGMHFFKDNDVSLTHKKTESQVQASLAAHEARIAAQQVKFNHNVPTIIEAEAPGFPIQ